jgi:hypothetical protein
MTSADRLMQLRCIVDDKLGGFMKHRQAKGYPSELLRIGILFALKGGTFSAFIAGSKAITSHCASNGPIGHACFEPWRLMPTGRSAS